ncbi:MAG: hypothetical protein FWD52_00395 [Candidatus Bathyarchaeota archaeon]|nr:hypothetical protein [Candidatus Termiticorpusculum sp.]
MSSQNRDQIVSKNSPVSITLGAVTYDNVEVLAWKYEACDGGDAMEPHTVASGHTPSGYTHKPKRIILIATIDHIDITNNLVSSGFWNNTGANSNLTALKYVEMRNDTRQTRTITFTAANSYVVAISPTFNQRGTQFTEVRISTYGNVTYSSWVNPTAEPLTEETPPPS